MTDSEAGGLTKYWVKLKEAMQIQLYLQYGNTVSPRGCSPAAGTYPNPNPNSEHHYISTRRLVQQT